MKRTGSIFKRKDGSWWARVVFTDTAGKRHDLQRRGRNKAHAQQRLDKLLSEIDSTEGRIVESEQMTFSDLADHYEQHYLIPAEIRDGRKVAGLRSHDTMKTVLNALREWFGPRRLKSIIYDDLRLFRERRLKTPTRWNTPRALATVHRELAMLRRMLNIAYRQGWIVRNPFSLGEPLINSSNEVKRQRVISAAEEQRLLAACTEQRAHLRPILIMLLDTGARRGEVIKLKWKDVDLMSRTIKFLAENTKTERERKIGITRRLYDELSALWERSPMDPEQLIFGIRSNFQDAWEKARVMAGLPDVRLHDLRHTAATRLAQSGMPLYEVARILGHADISTTFRYTNATEETASRAVEILERFQSHDESDDGLVN